MIQIDKTLISSDVLKEEFVCDLNACKGACCIEGTGGAPLEDDEIDLINENLDAIKPFMRDEGISAIEEDGVWYRDSDGDKLTTLVKGQECVFVNYDKNGIAKCSIEDAHRAEKSNFKKPISCYLYPIRLHEYRNFTALNYHRWDICKPACNCGSQLNVKVYQFLKEPLIRKFGQEWYEQLVAADQFMDG